MCCSVTSVLKFQMLLDVLDGAFHVHFLWLADCGWNYSAGMMYDMCITYARCKELCTRVSENDYPVAPPSLTPLPYGRYKVIGLLHLLVDYYPKTQFFKYSVIKFNVVLLKVPKRSPNCVYCHYCFLAPFHCYKTKLKTLNICVQLWSNI